MQISSKDNSSYQNRTFQNPTLNTMVEKTKDKEPASEAFNAKFIENFKQMTQTSKSEETQSFVLTVLNQLFVIRFIVTEPDKIGTWARQLIFKGQLAMMH